MRTAQIGSLAFITNKAMCMEDICPLFTLLFINHVIHAFKTHGIIATK